MENGWKIIRNSEWKNANKYGEEDGGRVRSHTYEYDGAQQHASLVFGTFKTA